MEGRTWTFHVPLFHFVPPSAVGEINRIDPSTWRVENFISGHYVVLLLLAFSVVQRKCKTAGSMGLEAGEGTDLSEYIIMDTWTSLDPAPCGV